MACPRETTPITAVNIAQRLCNADDRACSQSPATVFPTIRQSRICPSIPQTDGGIAFASMTLGFQQAELTDKFAKRDGSAGVNVRLGFVGCHGFNRVGSGFRHNLALFDWDGYNIFACPGVFPNAFRSQTLSSHRDFE